jgi:hypothetical protein
MFVVIRWMKITSKKKKKMDEDYELISTISFF